MLRAMTRGRRTWVARTPREGPPRNAGRPPGVEPGVTMRAPARREAGPGPRSGIRPGIRPRVLLAWALTTVVGAAACNRTEPSQTSSDAADQAASDRAAPDQAPGADCPTAPIAETQAPDVAPHHETPEFWLGKLRPGAADEVLVPSASLPALAERHADVPGAWRDPLSDAVADPELVAREIEERGAWMKARLDEHRYVEGQSGALAGALTIMASAAAADEVRIVVNEAQLWCVPLDSGLFKEPIDRDFDRNACASLHPGEIVRVLRRSEKGDWHYVDAGHTTGWLHAPKLTPPQPAEHLAPRWRGRHLVPLRDDVPTDGAHQIRLGTVAPIVAERDDAWRVLVPTEDGPVETSVPKSAAVAEGPLPLTRRNVWTMALSQLGREYGWGGRAGQRDCSRLLRDVLVSTGIQMARHSGVQAKLGTQSIDVSELEDAAKTAAIARAARRGVVLLYMKGHILLYLGEDQGQHYGVSAVSEWLEPCEGGPDSVHRIDRVVVTTLEVGRDTERTAFIERISRIVVFAPPGPEDVPTPAEPEAEAAG